MRLRRLSSAAGVLVLAGLLVSGAAQARSVTAHIDRVDTAVANLRGVEVELSWPADAPQGALRLHVREAVSPALGYRFTGLDWRCPLQRVEAADGGNSGWRCTGPVRGGGKVMQLSVAIDAASTHASLSDGAPRIELHRSAARPDATRIDLVQVPLAWAQALASQAWEAARITGGTLDSQLLITAPDNAPLRIAGPLALYAAGFDTPDGTIAAAGLEARLDIEALLGDRDSVNVAGTLGDGELLFGSTYVSLQQRQVDLLVAAQRQDGQGWQLPRLQWHDPGLLVADATAAFDLDGGLQALDARVHAPVLAPLRDGYLSGWLGMAGLEELTLDGSADARVRMEEGALVEASLSLHEVSLTDPDDRFGFQGLDGDLRLSSASTVDSELRWRGGTLHGIPFGAASLPFTSDAGALRLAEPVDLSILGGNAHFDHLQIRPPAADRELDIRFGLALQALDIAQLSEALDWPAFTGQLSGTIPHASYVGDRLQFDGGLNVQLFGGEVAVTGLSMERPFGVLPTLSADIAFNDIDLLSLTGAFDFGSISGKLDGNIAELRLVDWQAVSFSARIATDRHRGVRQRISQRAVQDLTSVGNASFVNSLQSQLIGFFDDFGYSKIGIGCTLSREVCTMDGIGSAGEGFILVRGSGLPRLTVVGFNRRVDWPTLVERLAAVGKGDVKPVVE
ncbi:hypothetical protein [Lysobacter sp. A421]